MVVCPLCATEFQGTPQLCPHCGAKAEELAKIDYLLDALEQARVKGDLSGSGLLAYSVLTRRYLDRQRELIGQVPVAAAEAASPDREWLTAATNAAAAAPGVVVSRTPTRARPQSAMRPQSRLVAAARAVPWSAWVAVAGALLLVAAVAAFAVFAWSGLAAGARVGILVALTALFYGGGLWLRRRLPVIGHSLLAVGAALVLVDGWSLLSAGGLHGLWWWALLFAVGSALHWAMSAWLNSGLFVASGAVAQVAWWWLLGSALAWPVSIRAALLSTVGLIWVVAAPAMRRGPGGVMGRMLAVAGPVLAGGAAIAAVVGVLMQPGWTSVGAALLVAVIASAAFELRAAREGPWVREAATLALLPTPAAFLSLPHGGSIWPAVALTFVAGVCFVLLAARRGGALRAAAGMFTLLAAPVLPGILGGGGVGPWTGAVASWLALGAIAVIAGPLLPQVSALRSGTGPALVCRVVSASGWLAVLGGSAVHIASQGVPLALLADQSPSSAVLTLLAVEAALAWLVPTGMRAKAERSAGAPVAKATVVVLTAAGLAGYAYSQFAAGLAVHWIAPYADHVWYSFVMLGLGAAWSHSRSLAMRRLLVRPRAVVETMWALTSGALVLEALIAAGRSGPRVSQGVLLAMAGVAWLAETARFGRWHYLPAASAALSGAAGLFFWAASSGAAGGLATVCAGTVLALAPLAVRRCVGWRLWWSLGGAAAALVGLGGAFSASWSARPALAVLAVAFAAPALMGLPGFAGPSALAGLAALCSLESWARADSWLGTATVILSAMAMLTPALARRDRSRPALGGTWSLALAGTAALAGAACANGVARWGAPSLLWIAAGDWGLVVLLCALSAYCFGWSRTALSKRGVVAALVVLLAALLVLLRAAHVRTPEAYLTLTAAWCVAVAWWSSRAERRRHLTLTLDVLAMLVGLGGLALLMVVAGLAVASAGHALWLICVAAALVAVGVALRVRLYFALGLAGAILATFWLTSSHFSALPSVIVIVAVVGGALIAMGAVGERRRGRLTKMARDTFAGWR